MSIQPFPITKFDKLVLLIILAVVALVVFLPQKANAIFINSSNIPTAYQSHQNQYARRCQDGPGAPIYLHGHTAWISRQSSPTNISPITITQGTPSIGLRWNVLANHCTENMSPKDLSGNIANKALKRQRYTVTGVSSSHGTVSGLDGYRDVVVSNTYGSPNLFYAKRTSDPNDVPVHDIFTLSGLSGLPPGTHTVVITVNHRKIARYHSDDASGQHVCVSAVPGHGASSIDDPNCVAGPANYFFQIIVEAPPAYNHVATHSTNKTQVLAGETVTIQANLCNRGGGIFYPQNNSSGNAPLVLRIRAPQNGSGDRFILQDKSNAFDQDPSTYITYSKGTNREITKTYRSTIPTEVEHARWEIRHSDGVPAAGSTNSEDSCGGFASGGRGPFEVKYVVPNNAVVGDQYCFDVVVAPKAGEMGPPSERLGVEFSTTSGSGVAASKTCITIVGQPYFSTYGGDTVAGLPANCSGWTTGSPGPGITNATIKAFNQGTNPYRGAGAQLAALAQTTITQFASGTLRAPADPDYLAFAHPVSTYGGNFGNAPCPPDYFNLVQGKEGVFSDTGNLHSLLSSYRNDPSSKYTYTGATKEFTGQATFTIDEDLFINENVIYGPWANVEDIPNLVVIVRGNIYINRTVTQVDATLISQPKVIANNASPANKGYIYTCASGLSAPSQGFIDSFCSNKLTLNGSLIAMGLRLHRTNGTLSAAPNNELSDSTNLAESFIFNPAVWLAPCAPGLCIEGTADGIRGLPPIL